MTLAAFLLPASLAVTVAVAQSPQPLGPPGLPATRFPAPARPVAGIVSDRWATEDQRERAGEAARVMDFLQVRPGMTVADIGAGSGYYVASLSPRVGPSGRVLAQDVVPSHVAELQRRVAKERLTNVTVGLGDPHDPRLPPRSVDLALLVHMYHEIEQPFGLMVNLLPALRPGARVAIVDTNPAYAVPRHSTGAARLRAGRGGLPPGCNRWRTAPSTWPSSSHPPALRCRRASGHVRNDGRLVFAARPRLEITESVLVDDLTLAREVA